jgi:SAM-dependent methyltransferase
VVLQRATGKTIRPGGLSLLEHALALFPFRADSRVLDVGCGMGATVAYLREKHVLRAAGLDLSRKLLAQCMPSLPRLRAHAEVLPVASCCLEGVVCECVLSLVTDPLRALSEFSRVLTPGGLIILSDIYRRDPRNNTQDLITDCCLAGAVTREEVLEWVTKAGFSIILWEDHSRLLAELAAKLIFIYGSMAAFWGQFTQGDEGEKMEKAVKVMRPGYYLIVASKP